MIAAMAMATSRLTKASHCSAAGADRPAAAARATTPAEATMKAAFMMLLAAMVRARLSTGAASCMMALSGTENRPPQAASAARSSRIRQPGGEVSTAAMSGRWAPVRLAWPRSKQKMVMPRAA